VGDLRPSLDAAVSAFGVPATVTRPYPDDAPVDTTGIWLAAIEEPRPQGTDFSRREPRRLLVLPRNVLATLPRGTVVLAPERAGDPVKTWKVDGFDRVVEPDCWRPLVIAAAP